MSKSEEKKGPIKKLLQTAGILREQDMTVRPGGGFIQLAGLAAKPSGMSKAEYIEKYGTETEISELVSKIEMRRSKLPRFTFWLCEKCRYRVKLPYDDRYLEKDNLHYCLACNSMRYIDGSTMRLMTKKEIAQFEVDEEESFKKAVEKTDRSNLYAANESRQRQGLEPLTMEQFKREENRRP
jgi:hypothetical protein